MGSAAARTLHHNLPQTAQGVDRAISGVICMCMRHLVPHRPGHLRKRRGAAGARRWPSCGRTACAPRPTHVLQLGRMNPVNAAPGRNWRQGARPSTRSTVLTRRQPLESQRGAEACQPSAVLLRRCGESLGGGLVLPAPSAPRSDTATMHRAAQRQQVLLGHLGAVSDWASRRRGTSVPAIPR